ncbi:MAG: aldehyde ferredoxin oxidoreductase family protein, partial [Ardenticatenales bacterium]|nr:aldehyde ferredoxin oxidoreductase family protein [Ardenticatenales bacterium]
HVHLSESRLWVEEPDEAFYRLYMGGGNIGLYYLLKTMPAGADPLGPENVLALTTSVLTGAPFSGQSRASVNAKSPLTGTIGDSQAGGFFPAELKFAGFDAVIVYGRAETPVYLWIHNGEAELRDARHLWGLGSWESESRLREELGDAKIEVACVGPAGENLVRYAAIMTMRNRAWGRTGMGAVMGSKQLKAIAVRGQQRLSIADPRGVKRVAGVGAKALQSNKDMADLGVYGTAGIVLPQQFAGGLPTRNYQSGDFPAADLISGERMAETILVERDTCYACVVRCKRVVQVEKEGNIWVAPELGGPEYETLATFGSYCEVSDLAAIARANALCNDYGLDTISCGATIAWAMECYEDGLLTEEDTDGVALRFGDAEAMLEAVERLAHRRGRLGNLLAEGSARAAAQLGPEAEARVVAVKGSEVPAHMPQVKRSLGLIYAVNPFGADHQSSEHDPFYEPGGGQLYLERLAMLGLTQPVPSDDLGVEKVRFALLTQYLFSLMDVLCLCQFDWGPAWQLYGPDSLTEIVRAVTGWEVTLEELMQVGARRVNLLKAFNAREGFTRAQDILPPRLFEPLVGGASDGLTFTREELERALDCYYELAGWGIQTGNPSAETLSALGLSWLTEPPL